jgi:translation initiation factor IF-1
VQAGVIREVLPNERFRCELADGEVCCHISGEMRLQAVRLLPGERVSVEVSPFDPSKGRIVAMVAGSGRVDS